MAKRFDRAHGVALSALALGPAGELPTEFRIFKAGVNETSRGNLLFDGPAAIAVMAAYKRDGVDLPIDLEHASIDANAFANRADASDARGWFQLTVRDGELWACNVTWTPDGARRLQEKTQRYISPVSLRDTETGRVEVLVNCAICAMPATYGAEPLVAASRGALARIADFATSRRERIDAGMAKVKKR